LLYSNRNTKGSNVFDVLDDITLIMLFVEAKRFPDIRQMADRRTKRQSAIEKCPTSSMSVIRIIAKY